MAVQPTPSDQPRAYFTPWQRLFRGYGPLAAFAALLVIMALLVPTKVHSSNVVAGANGYSAGSPSGQAAGGATAGNGIPASGGSPGVTGAPGAGGSAVGSAGSSAGGAAGATSAVKTAGAGVGPCPDRTQQVPGDPYSPPCFTFSGSNGGSTSQGVTASQIHVAFRVLDEKGFHQTLAELDCASPMASPAALTQTVVATKDNIKTT